MRILRHILGVRFADQKTTQSLVNDPTKDTKRKFQLFLKV